MPSSIKTTSVPLTSANSNNTSNNNNNNTNPTMTGIATVLGYNSALLGRSKVVAAAEWTWLQMASVAHQMGEDERVQAIVDLLLRHNPLQVGAYLRLGHYLHNRQQYWQAAEAYQRAISILESTSTVASSPLSPGDPNANQALLHGQSTAIPMLMGMVWGALAHCLLMMDELSRAFSAYQRALGWGPAAAQDAALWFGVGLLYDRYGANENALEAFRMVIKLSSLNNMEGTPRTTSADVLPNLMCREVYYRMGLLLRFQGQFEASRKCLEYIAHFPPAPLSRAEVRLQLGITLEALNQTDEAYNVLNSILEGHGTTASSISNGEVGMRIAWRAKALLGWFLVKHRKDCERGLNLLYEACEEEAKLHPINSPANTIMASVTATSTSTAPTLTTATMSTTVMNDALPWYFYGRARFLQRAYTGAYEAYQEAVYRDGQNVAYWNSIGILYLAIKQSRDALDAFTRALQLGPVRSEVWWNLGCLYEQTIDGNGISDPSMMVSGGNHNRTQLNDALDAYSKAAELDPEDKSIQRHILKLKRVMAAKNVISKGLTNSHTSSSVSSSSSTSDGARSKEGNETESNLLEEERMLQPRELDPFAFLPRSILLGASGSHGSSGVDNYQTSPASIMSTHTKASTEPPLRRASGNNNNANTVSPGPNMVGIGYSGSSAQFNSLSSFNTTGMTGRPSHYTNKIDGISTSIYNQPTNGLGRRPYHHDDDNKNSNHPPSGTPMSYDIQQQQ